MNTDDKIGYVQGVTLIFIGATESALMNIANTIGGNSTYCVNQGSVTHTYEHPYAVESPHDIAYLDYTVSQAGNLFAIQHCCTCVETQFHVNTSEKGFEILAQWQ